MCSRLPWQQIQKIGGLEKINVVQSGRHCTEAFTHICIKVITLSDADIAAMIRAKEYMQWRDLPSQLADSRYCYMTGVWQRLRNYPDYIKEASTYCWTESKFRRKRIVAVGCIYERFAPLQTAL